MRVRVGDRARTRARVRACVGARVRGVVPVGTGPMDFGKRRSRDVSNYDEVLSAHSPPSHCGEVVLYQDVGKSSAIVRGLVWVQNLNIQRREPSSRESSFVHVCAFQA